MDKNTSILLLSDNKASCHLDKERYTMFFGREKNVFFCIPECPKIYRKSVLHLLKYTANLYLSSTDMRYILGHSVVLLKPWYLH